MRNPILVFLIIITYQLHAQHSITYDFTASDPSTRITHSDISKPGERTVREGESCTFSVLNVNTFIYDVKINGTIVNLHSEQPEAFKVFFNATNFAASSDVAAISSTPETVMSERLANTKGANNTTNQGLVENYTRLVSEFKSALVLLESWKLKYDELLSIVQTDGKNGSEIIAESKQCMLGLTPGAIRTNGTNNYKNVQGLLDQLIQAINLLPEPEKSHKQDDLANINEIKSDISKYDYEKFFDKFSILYKQSINPKSYYVVSAPVKGSKDFIRFSVSISPRPNLAYAHQLESSNFDYDVRVRKGIKIDYSTGLYFAFGEARGRTYRLDPVIGDTASVSVMRNSPTAVALPALGAAIHGSWRFNPSLAAGGMLGLGLNSTTLTDANFYVGLSGIFGWEERFILNAGYAFNRVDYLKENYYVGQVLNKNTASANDLTAKTLRGGLFVGLTFNLSNKKKEGDTTGSK